MRMRRWRAGACLLLAVGVLLLSASLCGLAGVRDALEYAVTAPKGEKAAGEIDALIDAKKELEPALADCTTATTIGGICENASVSAGGQSDTAAVYAVGEGWFEVYPAFLSAGRRLTETELAGDEPLIMLDEALAFSLFGQEIPEDAKVELGGKEYRVVGAVRDRRSVGESTEHRVYIPLRAAGALDTLMVSAVPIPDTGARTLFESMLRSDWQEGGSFYSLEKEVMRRTILLRLGLLVFGLSGILALTRWMNGRMGRRVAAHREGLRWNYLPKLLPRMALDVLIALLGYGALLALLYALMVFSIRPLYVFTEWVPENFVEWSSLKKVFWNLTASAAKLVKVGTPQMRIVEFWGGLLRWGAICLLWSALLAGSRKLKK